MAGRKPQHYEGMGYTLVQHSGYGYGGDPTFRRGLETRMVKTQAQHDKIIRSGGIVFDTYKEAEEFAYAAMYPPGAGLVPEAKGSFGYKIDGLALYIPKRQVVG